MQPTPVDLYNEGWCLIPVSEKKTPMIATWKQYQSERPSLEQVEQWITSLNPPVWGAPTGKVSGRFTLDFDGEPGRETLSKLGWEPHRSTPNGGYHVDFTLATETVKSLNSKTKKLLGERYPGTDSRGAGGYINLLGSTAAGEYLWLKADRSPYDPSVVPQELMDLITGQDSLGSSPSFRRHQTGASLTDRLLAKALEDAVSGRNDAGFALACGLRHAHLSRDEAEEVMRRYFEGVPSTDPVGVETPYDWSEALASLDSAWNGDSDVPASCTGRREIVINGRQLSEVSDEALGILVETNQPPILFLRGGDKVAVRSDEKGRIRIDPLSNELLRHLLSQRAHWLKICQSGEVKDAFPSMPVVQDLKAREWSEVPTLAGVVEVPILRTDGSVLTNNGYDEATGLWMNLPDGLELPAIPDSPTGEDVRFAVGLLEEAVREFSFEDETSSANALGLILSAVFRPSIQGLIPIAVIDAPVAGNGKTYLASLASVIGLGRPASLSSAPNGNDEELRKRLTAALMADEALVVFDNIERRFWSPIVAQAVTSESWNDRVLGVSKNVDLAQHVVWVATGNNIEIGGDLPRRCYVIRLDAKLPQPARRKFERSDLLGWAQEHRGELLGACFVLARNWYVQGKPEPAGTPWASFEQWRKFIGGILKAAGFEGFLGNLGELQEAADPEVLEWARLLEYWLNDHEGHPVPARMLWASAGIYEKTAELPRSLAESLDRAAGDSSKVPRMNAALMRIKDRHFTDDGLRVEQAGRDPHAKVNLWRVVSDPPRERGADGCEADHRRRGI